MQYKRLHCGRFLALMVLVAGLTACEKKIDNTIPPDANTLSEDATRAFGVLSKENTVWYWDLTVPLAQGHLMASFNKDSTAALYLLQRYSLVNQLLYLANFGNLDDAEFDDVAFLYNTFRTYDDATVRGLLENPANAYFKNLTQVYLPNYTDFNGYYQFGLVDRPTYVINGPVQLSLTFNNSTILPSLKQARQLDYDFRIFGFSKDSVMLTGYYNTSSNKSSRLIPMSNQDAIPAYANASSLLMDGIFTRADIAIKMDGTLVPLPAGYSSGLNYFYRNFRDGVLNKQLMEFSFVMMNPALAGTPDVFKDVRFTTVTGSYDGLLEDAPAGTVVVTMAAYTASGGKKVLEFIKQ